MHESPWGMCTRAWTHPWSGIAMVPTQGLIWSLLRDCDQGLYWSPLNDSDGCHSNCGVLHGLSTKFRIKGTIGNQFLSSVVLFLHRAREHFILSFVIHCLVNIYKWFNVICCTIYMIGRANAAITVNRVTFMWPSIPRSSCGLADTFNGKILPAHNLCNNHGGITAIKICHFNFMNRTSLDMIRIVLAINKQCTVIRVFS